MTWKSLLTGGCLLLNEEKLMHELLHYMYFYAAISNHLSEKPKIWSLNTGLTVFCKYSSFGLFPEAGQEDLDCWRSMVKKVL